MNEEVRNSEKKIIWQVKSRVFSSFPLTQLVLAPILSTQNSFTLASTLIYMQLSKALVLTRYSNRRNLLSKWDMSADGCVGVNNCPRAYRQIL